MIISTLKQYLAEIEAIERQKPEVQQRKVPNLSEISRETGIHYTTISKMANNRAKRLDFQTAIKIIKYVRSLGHDMQLHHLIALRIDDSKALAKA